MNSDDAEVVVVGGGLAGLSCATRLAARGVRVRVFEASETVGGRTLSRQLGDQLVEFGAEWVGHRHVRLRTLIAALNLQLEATHYLTAPALWHGERRHVGFLPTLSRREKVEIVRSTLHAWRFAQRLSPDSPWTTSFGQQLDTKALGAWMRENRVGERTRSAWDAILGSFACTPIEYMSLLHLLWWIRRAGNPLAALRNATDHRVVEGTQAIAHGLAYLLGDRVTVAAPVEAVEQTAGAIAVHVDGREVRAKRAVMAVPFNALRHIALAPALDGEHGALVAALSVSPGTKTVALLECEPPSYALAIGGGLVAAAWRRHRCITGFAGGAACGKSDAVLMDATAHTFGVPAGALGASAVRRWGDEPFIGGADIGFLPGQLTRFGPYLRRPHHCVYFAAAERSSWPNNMEGAVESGQTVAADVLNDLSA